MIIELTSELAQDFDITLSDVDLLMRLDWNERASKWMLGIYKPDETPILVGRPLSIATPLLNRNVSNLPSGLLTLVHIDGELVQPTKDNLGDFFFEYLTDAEFEAELLEVIS